MEKKYFAIKHIDNVNFDCPELARRKTLFEKFNSRICQRKAYYGGW